MQSALSRIRMRELLARVLRRSISGRAPPPVIAIGISLLAPKENRLRIRITHYHDASNPDAMASGKSLNGDRSCCRHPAREELKALLNPRPARGLEPHRRGPFSG